MVEESVITPEMRQMVTTWRTEPMAFDVEKGAIKKFAQVIGDTNPLWTNEEQARKSKYGGLVAMPVFLMNFNPFVHGVARPQRPLPNSAAAGDAFEFLQPMRPGDLITVGIRFKDIYQKSGKSGPLVFLVDERTYTNQRGELVARSHWTWVCYNVPAEGKVIGREAAPEPTRGREHLMRGDPILRMEASGPASQQIFFEDVEVGMELPPLVRRLSHELFVRFFAVSSDWGSHHVDYLCATAEGWRDCIAQGLLSTSYLCNLMTNWMGLEGVLRKLGALYRAPGYPGDTWTCKGKVSKKYTSNGENWVDCEIWIENQDGVRVTPGWATVALASTKCHG